MAAVLCMVSVKNGLRGKKQLSDTELFMACDELKDRQSSRIHRQAYLFREKSYKFIYGAKFVHCDQVNFHALEDLN